MSLSTHVLDTSRGVPAAGIQVTLQRDEEGWVLVGDGTTDADGRIRPLLPPGAPLLPGTYRLTFALQPYFERHNVQAFYPEASITFLVRDATQHYHVPLLLNPWGYSTYRGSLARVARRRGAGGGLIWPSGRASRRC
jgi:5-hydroxyisourate hydrolase